MTYNQIRGYSKINETDENKVNELVKSMLENGWQGCPILVYGNELLTGSHRLEALRKIEDMLNNDEIESAAVLDEDIAEDVTEIIERNMAAFEEENGWAQDIRLNDIGWMLKDSWVEEYKNEIDEW
ncbi:ParB N-terminal domain-containing protein [Anaerotruncus rubiinfantis]|uniref:ParB N-terminal domain-containing protein n=1 Tax=Anaerotruncus rubiinfantis TaxID=1720200 RepID=UPI0034A36E40